MKILYVSPGFPPDIGGIEEVVRRLSVELSENGDMVKVLAPTNNREMIGEFQINENLTVERVKGYSPGGSYHFSPEIGRKVKQIADDFDLIHAHGYHAFPSMHAFLSRGGTPFVLSCHYHGRSHSSFRNLLLRIYRPFGGRMVRKSDCVFLVSAAEKKVLESHFRPNMTAVIHNGHSVPENTEKRSKGRIVSIGRLESYKNHAITIDCVLKNPALELDIIGDGPEYSRLRKKVEASKAGNRVRFHRGADDEEKWKIVGGASCLVSLSEIESFGMVLVEGASMGLRVVASNIPSHREIAEVLGGIELVDIKDPSTLESSIVNAAMGKELSYKGIKRFHWSEVSKRYLEVYREILTKSGSVVA